MTVEEAILRCLSLNGKFNVVLDARGMFQVSVSNRDASWRCHVSDDPIEAIVAVASRITSLDLPSYDVLEVAAKRRSGQDGYLESVERSLAPKPVEEQVELELTARDISPPSKPKPKALPPPVHDFSDILG